MSPTVATLRDLITIGRSADPQFDRRMATLAAFSLAAAIVELMTLGSLIPLLAFIAQGSGGDSAALGPYLPRSAVGLLVTFAILILVTALIRLALTAAIQRRMLAVGHAINTGIQRRLLDQPYAFHAATNSSLFVTALQKSDLLTLGLLRPLLQGFAGLLIGSSILVFLVTVAGWQVTGGVLLLLGGAYLALSRLAGRRLVERGRDSLRAYDDQVRLMMESSGAIRDILLDQRQSVFAAAFERASERMASARAGTDLLAQAPRYLVEALGAIALALLAVVIAAREGGIGGSLTMFGLLALAMVRIVPLAQTAYSGWSRLAANRQAVTDVAELLALPALPKAERPQARLRLASALEARGVAFRYPGGNEPALRDVNLEIRRGQWVGLTGATGCGKSTLGDLLMGLLDPDAGQILVDGIPVTPAMMPRWQRSIGHVSQTAYLIDDTIAANITLLPRGDGTDRDRIAECARIAQLDAWIQSLERGLETRVGERGQRLSGGQRQRIAIARALYKDADLLILDEATNALDQETEQAFFGALRAARADLTVVLISHRQSTLDRCDHILRLDGGRLTAV